MRNNLLPEKNAKYYLVKRRPKRTSADFPGHTYKLSVDFNTAASLLDFGATTSLTFHREKEHSGLSPETKDLSRYRGVFFQMMVAGALKYIYDIQLAGIRSTDQCGFMTIGDVNALTQLRTTKPRDELSSLCRSVGATSSPPVQGKAKGSKKRPRTSKQLSMLGRFFKDVDEILHIIRFDGGARADDQLWWLAHTEIESYSTTKRPRQSITSTGTLPHSGVTRQSDLVTIVFIYSETTPHGNTLQWSPRLTWNYLASTLT